MKKMVVAILAGTMLLSNGLQVSAAGMRDVFDAKYYAEQYKDLKDAFGDNEEALYKHFVEYGLKEGRNMNPIIDIAKYRKQYEDLDKAFGDNWDAYVEHYFNYGVKENRDNGTSFDVKKYVSSYEDLSKAFGDDYKKAAKHYMEYGKKENRDKGNKEQIVKPANKPVVQKPVSLERSERTDYAGGWSIADFNAKGECVKVSYYLEDGSLDWYLVNEYDAKGVHVKQTSYNADGTVNMLHEYFYHKNGKLDYSKGYYNDGGYIIQKYDEQEFVVESFNYDANGELTGSSVNVMENGEWVGTIYYDAAGNVIMEYKKVVAEDGTITFVPVEPEEDENEEVTGFTGTQEYVNTDGSKTIMEFVDGLWVKSSIYKADGTLDYWTAIAYDEQGREIGSTTYDADGKVLASSESVLDANGVVIERKSVDLNGCVTINKYDYVNGYHTLLCYNADGSFSSHNVYRWDENHDYVDGKAYDANGNVISEYDMVKDADGNYTLVPKEA